MNLSFNSSKSCISSIQQSSLLLPSRLFELWFAPKILPLGKMQSSLLLPSLIRTLAAPKILRLGIIKPLVCFCARLFVSLVSPKILPLGKMQSSLLLPSLIRIFDSVLDTSASAMLK